MVIDKRHLDLIHRSIDGELSDSEQIVLERILAESSQEREFHTQLLSLNRLRDLVPVSDPPSDLKARILDGIAPGHTCSNRRPTDETFSIWSSLQSLFTPRLAYGLAAGLLLGLALGVGGRHVVNRTALSPSDISATLVVGQREGESRIIDSDSFEQTGFSGGLSTQISGQRVFMRLQLRSTGRSQVKLAYDPSTLRFWALQQSNSGLLELRNDPGQISLSHLGSDTYMLVFERTASAATRCTLIIGDGEASYERTIQIPN